jgi:hypothetical protein
LNSDGQVNADDADHLVFSLLGSTYGDANLDRTFNSRDFITVFQAGEYEDNLEDNSGWAEGDWNCDADFNTRDLVTAFIVGDYVANAVAVQPSTPQGPPQTVRLADITAWRDAELGRTDSDATRQNPRQAYDGNASMPAIPRSLVEQVFRDSLFLS